MAEQETDSMAVPPSSSAIVRAGHRIGKTNATTEALEQIKRAKKRDELPFANRMIDRPVRTG